MNKTSKKILALFVALMMLAAFIPFNVFAIQTYTYTITFTVTEGNHTISETGNSGEIAIDGMGNIITLKDTEESAYGVVNVAQDGKSATITVTNDLAGTLNFGATTAFGLYMDNNPLAANTQFTTNKTIEIKNYSNPEEQLAQQATAGLNISFEGNAGGKVWYKFNTQTTETEVVGNRTNIAIPENATSIVFRGEDRTIGRLDVAIGQMGENLDKDKFRSTTGVEVTDINSTSVITLTVEYKNDQQNDQQNNQQSGGPDDIVFDIEMKDTNVLMNINDKLFMDDADGLRNTFKGKVTGAGYKDSNHKNRIWIMNSFGDSPVIEATINGIIYKKGESGVTIGQDGEFIVEVPGAAEYIIRGKGDPDFIKPRTIIWTNPNYVPKDDADAQWIQEFKLEHGYGYVTAVYDENGKLVNPDAYKSKDWVVNANGGGVGKDGFGWITVHPGYKVVFEFVPEYGFQLTDIRINGQKLGVSGLMNTFEFTMPNTNIHFDAVFTATEDVVKSGSDKVTGATVELGGALPGGSAQLTVNDVELSSDKIQGFSNAANGYTVSDYLNISLFNVYYKGKADSEDVWSNEIEELDEYVTISIQLEEDINAEDIVIVHNIHDGNDYEVIEIESYDPETRILTFKTKSFSNYAIATKEKANVNVTPKTGDNIGIFFTIFTVASIGAFTLVIVNRKNKRMISK